MEQIKAGEEYLAEFTRERSKINNLLVAGSTTVRYHAVNRLSSRIVLEIVGADNEIEITHKVPHRSYKELQLTIGDGIEAFEKAGERRIKLSENSAIYK